MIIDFHTHIFPDHIAEKTIDYLGRVNAHIFPFTDGRKKGLTDSMQAAKISHSVTLPVITNPEQVEKINHSILREKDQNILKGLIPFGGMHPHYPEKKRKALLKLLKTEGILGIKLHPAYQGMDFNDLSMKRLIYEASEENLIIISHAGLDIGLYDRNYASVEHVLDILQDVAPTKLVLAHMGNWGCWQEVESDLAGAPVWFDTAFCLDKITAHPKAPTGPAMQLSLSEEGFIRLCKKHGTKRILFATDSPWMDQSRYVECIQHMPLDEQEKSDILYRNAKNLLWG